MASYLSMVAFSLATSITPGPVNVVALGAGARHGWRAAMRHVTGATVGYSLLLICMALGLHAVLLQWPAVATGIQWAGVAFLLYMAVRLALDDGRIGQGERGSRPSLLAGAAMQWLNPKAWLAALAGIGSYAPQGEAWVVSIFVAIYFVVCFASIACWACAGAFWSRHLHEPGRVRLFNRSMAIVLLVSIGYLLAD